MPRVRESNTPRRIDNPLATPAASHGKLVAVGSLTVAVRTNQITLSHLCQDGLLAARVVVASDTQTELLLRRISVVKVHHVGRIANPTIRTGIVFQLGYQDPVSLGPLLSPLPERLGVHHLLNCTRQN